MITDEDREIWGDLARRLCAAWLSYRNGLRGVDYTLKRYAPDDEPIGDLWIEIAKKVHDYASGAVSDYLRDLKRPEE